MRAFEFLTEYNTFKYRDGRKPPWYEKAVQLKTDNPRISAVEISRQVHGIGVNPVLHWLTGKPDYRSGHIYNDNPPFKPEDFPIIGGKKYFDEEKPPWYDKAVQLKTDNPRMFAQEIGRQVGTTRGTVLSWLTGRPDGRGYIYNDNPPFTSSDFPWGSTGMKKYFDGAKPDWYQQAVAMRKQGMTYPAIANRLSTPEKKVSKGVIMNWLVKGSKYTSGNLINPDAPFTPKVYNKNKFSQVEKVVKELIDAKYTDEDIIEWIKQDTPKLALAVKEKLPQLRAEMNPQTQVRDKVTGQDITGFIEEMGFAGIPDYKTMPAYKLKKASKGKHKFFLPTDAPVPAGVSALDEYNLDNKRDK